MKKSLLLLFLLIFSWFNIQGFGQTGSITGIIKDAESGETLPFCSVFINNTTISTVTDMEGAYTLSGLEAGPVELGFSFMGYIAQTKNVTLSPGGKLTVNIDLKPFAQELTDVEIQAKRDKAWERDLRKFENLFIGIDDAAAKTKILNSWVIDFPVSTEKNVFLAKADQPLEIENSYLGYKIIFNLKDFYDSPTNYRIIGAARFEEMSPASEEEKTSWERNRADVYRKSPMNMFRSLLNGTAEREGFYLYGNKAGGSESMNIRSDIFSNELGKSVVPYKADPLVTPTSPPGTFFLNLKGRIEIHYQKGFAQANTYKDAPYPISWMEVTGGRVKVKENGMILNPQDVVFSGDMDRKRVSNLLPLDYNATKAIQLQELAKTAKNYQEKVYLHTDKPYYYAGDQLFFKGYFAYGNPYLRDELSKVLHVELISEDRDILVEKKFPIRDGIVVGDFYLPDSLAGEKYFLRAYTNWMRNYGPSQYFLQTLTILDPYKRLAPEEAVHAWTNKGVSLEADKKSIGVREKVTVKMKVSGKDGRVVPTTLSVGIWDAKQLVPIQRNVQMNEALDMQSISEDLGLERFSYPIERSLSLTGKVADDKGKATSVAMTAFVNDFQGMLDLQSGIDGTFELGDMEFYGPMQLAISALDKKGKQLNVSLDQPLKAPVSLPADPVFPKITILAKPVRSVETTPELESKKSEESIPKSKPAIYGEPDFVVKGEDLTKTGVTTDLVNSLAGHVPSMSVNNVGSSGIQQIRIRGGAASRVASMEPIVMLNGTILGSAGGSNASENLRSINPFDIERVEVVTRMSPMLGDQGKNGVIAVYTKDKLASDDLSNMPGVKEFLVQGYQPQGNFIFLDYEHQNEVIEKDDRQTLYWNPFLVVDEKGEVSLSFFTNDSGGPVVVEIRGLNIDGEPVFGTFLLNEEP